MQDAGTVERNEGKTDNRDCMREMQTSITVCMTVMQKCGVRADNACQASSNTLNFIPLL